MVNSKCVCFYYQKYTFYVNDGDSEYQYSQQKTKLIRDIFPSTMFCPFSWISIHIYHSYNDTHTCKRTNKDKQTLNKNHININTPKQASRQKVMFKKNITDTLFKYSFMLANQTHSHTHTHTLPCVIPFSQGSPCQELHGGCSNSTWGHSCMVGTS